MVNNPDLAISIVDKAYDLANKILEENRNYLEEVAAILMEKEKMSAEEFYGIFGEPAAAPENA